MAIIKTLKDKLGNIIYPQTLIKSVYDEDGKTLDTLMAGKVSNTRKVNGKTLATDVTLTASDVGAVSAVASATAGNIPTLTADGQLVDSGKKADELGGAFVVTQTNTYDGTTWTTVTDKTYNEIKAAHEAGKEIRLTIVEIYSDTYKTTAMCDLMCIENDGTMRFSPVQPYVSTNSFQTFTLSNSDNWEEFYGSLVPPAANENAGTILMVKYGEVGGNYWDVVIPPFLKEVSSTTENHIPAFDANGQLVDSGKSVSDLSSGSTVSQRVYSGTSTPSSSLGSDGDIYIKYSV